MATENIKNIVTYEQFGAKGDGKTDDFAAMKAAHEYANQNGLEVHAAAGKSYYIGNSTYGEHITVQTNTFWHGATVIFDDSKIAAHKHCGCKDCKERSACLFHIKPSYPKVDVLDAVKSNLPILSAFDGEGTKRFDNWPLEYDALVHIKSDERKVFIRVGANADSGDSINEVLLVHKDGTIDPSTPISWNYKDMTSAVAYNAEEEPVTLDGGGATVLTIANKSENNGYFYYARNIMVTRSNTKVCNLVHVVEEEQEFRAPYKGLLCTERCHNITYENIVLQAARRKYVASNNQQGTYEIGGHAANDIKFINVNVSNFFATGAAHDYYRYGILHTKGQIGNRGMMGTNYCRNFYFKDCRLVNFDAHKGMGNLTMENCEVQTVLIMGAGKVNIKNTVCYADNHKSMIHYRSDYGASFRGDITLENIELKYSEGALANPESSISIIELSYDSNNDYDTDYNYETGEYECGEGSTNYMATNIYVKGAKLTKYRMVDYVEKNERGFNDIVEEHLEAGDPLYVINKGIAEGFMGNDISKFAKDGGYSDKNRYIPPESIVVEDSCKNIVLPSSTTFKNNTKMFIDGREVEI